MKRKTRWERPGKRRNRPRRRLPHALRRHVPRLAAAVAGVGVGSVVISGMLLGAEHPGLDPPTIAAYMGHGTHQPHATHGSAVPDYVLNYTTIGSNTVVGTAAPALDPDFLYRLVAASQG
jgi:hypothetical protein